MEVYLAHPGSVLQTCLIFLLIVAPVYLVFRWFVKLVRQAYGFDEGPLDMGQPLRVCGSCHNTVLESDFSHCPYCGASLPAVEPVGPRNEAGADAVGPDESEA